jgi:hypothetical protein
MLGQLYQSIIGGVTRRKDLDSVTLLVSWEIWNERNGRVFKNKQALHAIILENIKRESKLWVLAGVKRMGNLMLRE